MEGPALPIKIAWIQPKTKDLNISPAPAPTADRESRNSRLNAKTDFRKSLLKSNKHNLQMKEQEINQISR
jgi:hypothetical protein